MTPPQRRYREDDAGGSLSGGSDMLKRIDHVGVVVDDLDQAMSFLGGALGLPLSRTFNSAELNFRAAFFRSGDVDIELIQLFDEKARARRLGTGPARVEHIAIEVEGPVEDAVSQLGAKGIEMDAPAALDTGPTRSFWTRPETSNGIVFQFLQRMNR